MRTLILDQYSRQSTLTRWVGNSLTGLGWGFWIFLWLPLLAAIASMLALNSGEQPATEAAQSIPALLATLKAHLTTVLTLICLFLFWAVLQSLGKCQRLASLQKTGNPFSVSIASFDLNRTQLQSYRSARLTVVSHEHNGIISNVVILNVPVAEVFFPEPLPQAA